MSTLTMLTTNPPRNAFHQTGSEIIKPNPNDWPITLVSQNRKVLITSVNKPSVKDESMQSTTKQGSE